MSREIETPLTVAGTASTASRRMPSKRIGGHAQRTLPSPPTVMYARDDNAKFTSAGRPRLAEEPRSATTTNISGNSN